MRNTTTKTIFGAALALSATLLTGAVHAQNYGSQNSGNQSARRLAVGTPIKVTLAEGLSSTSAHVGDRVRVQVSSDDNNGLPSGTTFVGRVRAVRAATAKQPGAIDIRFDNGTNYDSASFVPDEGSAHLTGKTASGDKSNFIQYGAGGGALLGLLRAGKVGDALEGAAIGAVGGYAADAAQKHSAGDVTLKSGDTISMRLDRPLSLRTEINAY